jgi:uncharacterized Ntn-hydrolase superfamily protein
MTQSFGAMLTEDDLRSVDRSLLDRLDYPKRPGPVYALATTTFPPGVGNRVHVLRYGWAALVQGMVDEDFERHAGLRYDAPEREADFRFMLDRFSAHYRPPEHAARQIALFTPKGVVLHRGAGCIDHAEERRDETAPVAALANIMNNKGVPQAMMDQWKRPDARKGDLQGRLTDVLLAGRAQGRDMRGLTSSALTLINGSNPRLALAIRIDCHNDPVGALRNAPWHTHMEVTRKDRRHPVVALWDEALSRINTLIQDEKYRDVDMVVDDITSTWLVGAFATEMYLPAFVAKQASAAFKRGDVAVGQEHLARLPTRWLGTLLRDTAYCPELREELVVPALHRAVASRVTPVISKSIGRTL